MSVALLQDREHEHEHENIRWSRVCVACIDLVCTALHCPQSSRQCRAVHDALWWDSYISRWDCDGRQVEEGHDPPRVTFRPPALHKLINELCIWFKERYRVLERCPWMFSEESDPEDYDAIEARHRTLCEVIAKTWHVSTRFPTKACVGWLVRRWCDPRKWYP